MTRLTPKDEKRMRVDDSCYSQPQNLALDRRILLAEIDALRAERDMLQEEGAALRIAVTTDKKQLMDTIASLRAEIATFRNASPSLCNCSQCLDIREEFSQ